MLVHNDDDGSGGMVVVRYQVGVDSRLVKICRDSRNVLVANANPDAKLPSYVPKICDFGLADMLYSDASYVNLTRRLDRRAACALATPSRL